MHIVLIISSLLPGGAERVLSQLANGWISHGHKITIITFSDPNVLPFYYLDERICLHQLNQLVTQKYSLFKRLKNIIKRILALRHALKHVKPDVIISFVDVTNITTLLAGIRLRVPIIVGERIHPYYHDLPLFYRVIRKLIYPWAAKVVSQSASASNYFTTLSEEKKTVIPNQVIKSSRLKEERDILNPVSQIISIGRLCEQKDFTTLILAFSKIVAHYQNLRLTIYGEGAERPILEALIQKLNLTAHVFLPGTVQDIEGVLYRSDLFVFPSRYEGFPNALCEAMAMGLPVIASNCSGNIDIIREGVDGRLFGVGDVAQLIRLMEELIEDAPQRVRLSEGALDLPDRFSEASVLQKWDAVLAEVAGFREP
jgi:glycosyltransferase involved in cell wall biosynthesis